MIKINCTKKPDSIDEKLLSTLTSPISQNKKERIMRFKRREDAYRALVADILIRTMACRFLGIRNTEIKFKESEYGKPYLLNYNDYHFNISHSGDWVVCAIDSRPIGIDVEQIREVDFGIARHFFSKMEYLELSKKTGNNKVAFFYDLWTLKESYIKATGDGFSKEPDSFTIAFGRQGAFIENPKEKTTFQKYYFKQYNIDKNYKMAVCSQNREFPGKVTVVGFRELCDDFMHFVE